MACEFYDPVMILPLCGGSVGVRFPGRLGVAGREKYVRCIVNNKCSDEEVFREMKKPVLPSEL